MILECVMDVYNYIWNLVPVNESIIARWRDGKFYIQDRTGHTYEISIKQIIKKELE